jgi:L-threonylcarbamoyladenylate synthase
MVSTADLINIDDAPELAVNHASNIFNKGEIFIYPTDTVYGFGCNPFNKTALKKLDAIKGRVGDKRYILLIDRLEMLFKYIETPDEQKIVLLKKNWPNPISVILRLNDDTIMNLGYDSAAFRIPDNTFCINLLNKVKTPLVSTSVNITGAKQLNNFSEIKREFAGKVSAIFYTMNKKPAEPSTLIDLTKSEPVILREGKIKFIEL